MTTERETELEAALREGVAAVEKYVALSEGRFDEGPTPGLSTRSRDRARRSFESAGREARLFLEHARAVLAKPGDAGGSA